MQNTSLGCIIHINYNDCQQNRSIEIHSVFWMIFNLFLFVLSIITFRRVYIRCSSLNVLVVSLGFWSLSSLSAFLYDLLCVVNMYLIIIPPTILSILYLLAVIFKVDTNYFTYSQGYCESEYGVQYYVGIDCSKLTSDFKIEYSTKSMYIQDNRRVRSERDYCEYMHENKSHADEMIKLECQRPPFFKQE